MTKQEAINKITATLQRLDDERLQAVAEMIQSIDDTSSTRPLTDRELSLLARSREDFQQGRTLTSAEARASIDDDLARLGVPRPGA
jgi:hypothetical protein